ncbi:MAG: hydroxyethylthiazole kinase [Proteocatella sp.]
MKNHKYETVDMLRVKDLVRASSPLIHCITNHISINDCANAVLAVGARPIMAEHPLEVNEITSLSKSLAVNLGNINDSRMEAMLISGKAAHENNIPCVIDLVGVGCSQLRLNYANKFIRKCKPNIIKGNISEIKAICGKENDSKGIDSGSKDSITAIPPEEILDMLTEFAQNMGAIVVATGVIDIISDGNSVYILKNGCEKLSSVTGTGCMLNCLIASYATSRDYMLSAISAVALMGICGELSSNAIGCGSFRTELLDNLSNISDEVFLDKIKFIKIEY